MRQSVEVVGCRKLEGIQMQQLIGFLRQFFPVLFTQGHAVKLLIGIDELRICSECAGVGFARLRVPSSPKPRVTSIPKDEVLASAKTPIFCPRLMRRARLESLYPSALTELVAHRRSMVTGSGGPPPSYIRTLPVLHMGSGCDGV